MSKEASSTSTSSDTNPYSLDVWKILLNAYTSRKNCDVRLRCGDEEFPAHKLWLTLCIPYFDTAVGTGVGQVEPEGRGQATGPNESADPFDLRESPISGDAMKLVLDVVYGRSKHITEENCLDVHQAANYLGLEDLAGSCVDEMIANVSVVTVFQFITYARKDFPRSTDVFRACQQFLINAVDDVICQRAFHALEADCLSEVCCRERTYHVPDMQACLRLALSWILEDPQERSKTLEHLLSCILIGDIDFSKMCVSEPYLRFMASDEVSCQSKSLLSKMADHQSEAELDALLGTQRCRTVESLNVFLIASRIRQDNLFTLKLSKDTSSWEPVLIDVDRIRGIKNYWVVSTCTRNGADVHFLWLGDPINAKYKLVLLDWSDIENSYYLEEWYIPASVRKKLSINVDHAMGFGFNIAYGSVHIWHAVHNALTGEYGIHCSVYDPFCGDNHRPVSPISYSFHDLEPFHPSARFYSYGAQIWSSSEVKSLHLVLNRGIKNPCPALLRPLFTHLLPGVTTYKRKLYVAGGAEGQRKVEYFDPELSAWFELPSLPRSHEEITLAAARDHLFVIQMVGQNKNVDLLDLTAIEKGWQRGPDISSEFPANDPPGKPGFVVISN